MEQNWDVDMQDGGYVRGGVGGGSTFIRKEGVDELLRFTIHTDSFLLHLTLAPL